QALAELCGPELVTAIQARLARKSGDLGRFSDAEQLVLVEAWDRVTSWVAAKQRTAIAAFAAHRGYATHDQAHTHEPNECSGTDSAGAANGSASSAGG